MTISITRYVDITSGVGAGQNVARRNLVGRLFSINPLIPVDSFISFTSAADVGSYFGTGSEEHARAAFYFSWISKNQTRAQSIQFARWAQSAVAPYIIGAANPSLLAAWTSITDGAFAMVINGSVIQVNGLNFSTAANLAAIASTIQTALRLISNPQLATCTVSYEPIRGSFNFSGTIAQGDTLAIQSPIAGTNIVTLLGWSIGAIISNGSAVESITGVLDSSSNASDNFGSFLFMPTLSIDQVLQAANWNKLQNIKYLYTVAVISANAVTWFNTLNTVGGVALTLSNTVGQYPEMVPMTIEAATDYTRANSGQNYMFQQFAGINASVQNDIDANTYDELRVNYYGRTQSAGQVLDFYQRGVLMGLGTDPLDMNVYVNEIWLKAAATAAIMTLLLSVNEVSANARGRAQLLVIIQDVINQALNNGVISVGKLLNADQKLKITEISADENAWYQIQNIGYWVDCVITSTTGINGITEYQANYLLIYSKDDVIRKVMGTHTLI